MANAMLQQRPPKKGKIVGWSLSKCIKDMANLDIPIGRVTRIVTDTNVRSPENWPVLIGRYRLSYWKNNPDKAEEICWALIRAGKIIQPRVEGKPIPIVAHGHWSQDN